MLLSQEIVNALLESESKALATNGDHGINVVPVSTIRIVHNKIFLMNYFLKKTLENIKMQPDVALVSWKGLRGYQIKGTIEYTEDGAIFEESKSWVNENVPNRTLLGLLIMTPKEVHNISPNLK